MLVYSAQHKIVNDISLSFQKHEKIHTKISEKILTRDLQFINPKKYQAQTTHNFKFMVLWTVFKNNTTKIDTLKLINSYDKNTLKDIVKSKEKLIYYKNTIKKDENFMNTFIKSPQVVFDKYRNSEISVLYVYRYFKKIPNANAKLTRIQKRQIERINFFMSFFPKIEDELLI